mmetsp:Transcript_7323/g.26617  ORF Transcript_7323/g.26617 Transcript_7323/m.26617 type:complete len:205 (+) Transcript_7323:318-932(+)
MIGCMNALPLPLGLLDSGLPLQAPDGARHGLPAGLKRLAHGRAVGGCEGIFRAEVLDIQDAPFERAQPNLQLDLAELQLDQALRGTRHVGRVALEGPEVLGAQGAARPRARTRGPGARGEVASGRRVAPVRGLLTTRLAQLESPPEGTLASSFPEVHGIHVEVAREEAGHGKANFGLLPRLGPGRRCTRGGQHGPLERLQIPQV